MEAGYRIMLVDDHVLLRQGVRRIIESVEGMVVTAEAGDGEELLALLPAARPDLVVLDISLPRVRGVEALRLMRREYPKVQVLILTMHREYLHQALAAGAAGYLLKEDADRELFSALERIREGKRYVSPRLRSELAHSEGALPEALSRRESEVLALIARGHSSREISDELAISVRTVEAHRASILGKLNLRNTAEAVRYAIEKGFV